MANGRCHLPQPDENFAGRDKEVETIISALNKGMAVSITATAGVGKSSVACAAGWAMWRSGSLPNGAMFVDLRGARTRDDVMQRLAAAPQDKLMSVTGGLVKEEDIPLIYRQICAKGAALLVVDNAEDVMKVAGKDQNLLSRLLGEVGTIVRPLKTGTKQCTLHGTHSCIQEAPAASLLDLLLLQMSHMNTVGKGVVVVSAVSGK
jgi:hypothetical protein